MNLKKVDMKTIIFEYIDRAKEVISNDVWGNILLNSSKNEVFILILLYRNQSVNMTQIAEYVSVPLNTATGIVARMEKRGWVYRNRSAEDKRVVTIELTAQGTAHMNQILTEFIRYGTRIMEELTDQEMLVLETLFDKIIRIMNDMRREEQPSEHKKVIKKITIE